MADKKIKPANPETAPAATGDKAPAERTTARTTKRTTNRTTKRTTQRHASN